MIGLLLAIATLLMVLAMFRVQLDTERTLIRTWESLAGTHQRLAELGRGDPDRVAEAERWLRRCHRRAATLRVLSFDWLWPVKSARET